MSTSTKLPLLFLLFSLPLTLSSRPQPTPPSPAPAPESGITLIEHTCNIKYFNQSMIALCVSVIESDPRSTTVSNIVDLTTIACDVTLADLSDTISYVSKLQDDTTDTKDKDTLGYIIFCYDEMVRNVKDAIKFAKDPKSRSLASFEAMNANDQALICVNQAKELRGGPPPELVRRTEYMLKLTEVIATVTDNLNSEQ